MDAVTVLNRLGIEYKKQGSNYLFKCINPQHFDTKPSMSMNEEGLYQCWSCGEKGNLHTFVKAITGTTLYKFFDIKDPISFEFKANLIKEQQRRREEFEKPKERSFDMQGLLFDPLNNTEVSNYLKSINMSEEFIKYFDVKYTYKSQMRFYDNVDYTNFYNRITIPVYKDKKLINMIGRDFTGKQIQFKEIYPRGSTTDTFFNIDNVQLDKPIILVEGMKGLIRIWQHFNKNVMSSFGSSLGKNQREIIKNLQYLLVFCDNDSAGFSMVDKIYELRDKDFAVTAMKTIGHDPADGSLENLKYAITHPMQSVTYYLRRHNMTQSNTMNWS